MVVNHGYDGAKAKLARDCREGDGGEKAMIEGIRALTEKMKG
jgi:hypothetical protein